MLELFRRKRYVILRSVAEHALIDDNWRQHCHEQMDACEISLGEVRAQAKKELISLRLQGLISGLLCWWLVACQMHAYRGLLWSALLCATTYTIAINVLMQRYGMAKSQRYRAVAWIVCWPVLSALLFLTGLPDLQGSVVSAMIGLLLFGVSMDPFMRPAILRGDSKTRVKGLMAAESTTGYLADEYEKNWNKAFYKLLQDDYIKNVDLSGVWVCSFPTLLDTREIECTLECVGNGEFEGKVRDADGARDTEIVAFLRDDDFVAARIVSSQNVPQRTIKMIGTYHAATDKISGTFRHPDEGVGGFVMRRQQRSNLLNSAHE